MRILAAPLAALAALALVACQGAPGEPLQGQGRDRTPAPAAEEREELSAEARLRLDMIAEIALAMGDAIEVSTAAAEAGLARNQVAAEMAAAQMTQVAAQVQQRAAEVVGVMDELDDGGCGDDAAEASDEAGVSDQDINDAVSAALCAASAAQDVSIALVPAAPTTECVCGVCEEVPGGVDEAALTEAIDSVTAAAEACGDSEDVLTDGNNTSL
ncbi:MAG: hypothetical protein IT382_02770 [Deltaproteobacteria bacterium]|nr:hypothetical protein [Deltaproteobacteria bacterium]